MKSSLNFLLAWNVKGACCNGSMWPEIIGECVTASMELLDVDHRRSLELALIYKSVKVYLCHLLQRRTPPRMLFRNQQNPLNQLKSPFCLLSLLYLSYWSWYCVYWLPSIDITTRVTRSRKFRNGNRTYSLQKCLLTFKRKPHQLINLQFLRQEQKGGL